MTVDELPIVHGFNASLKDKKYQNFLDQKVKSVFGDKKELDWNTFVEKEQVLNNIFDNLNKKDQEQLTNIYSSIFSLEDNTWEKVTFNEYKTLLAVLDAKEGNVQKYPMLMDGKFSVEGKSSGIYSLDVDQDITPYARQLKWSNMTKEELLAEIKSKAQATLDSDWGGENKNYEKLIDIVSMARIYAKRCEQLNGMSYENILKSCLGQDNVLQYNGSNKDAFPTWMPQNYSKSEGVYYIKGFNKPYIITMNYFNGIFNLYENNNGEAFCTKRYCSTNWSNAIGYL